MVSRSRQKRLTRLRLWNEQGGLCIFCEQPTVIESVPDGARPPHNLATLDHVVPLARGGAFAPTQNCVLACYTCNHRRDAMPFDDFRALMRREAAA